MSAPMESEGTGTARRPAPLSYLVPTAAMIWRAAVVPPAELWKDWVIAVSVWWIFHLGIGRFKAGPLATTAFMVLMLGRYLYSHGPSLVRILSSGPQP